MISSSWQLVTEACAEEGWSEVDITNLKDLVTFVNSFQALGARKEDLGDWRPQQRARKMLVLDELLSMAIRHSMLVEVGGAKKTYVGLNLDCDAEIASSWIDKG